MRPRGSGLSLARAGARRRGFTVASIASVKRAYRLALSAPVAAEWETVVEAHGAAGLSQTNAARKPAQAFAANGQPVATFDGTDMWLMTLDAAGAGGNNATAEWELHLWFKVADLAAGQRLFAVDTSTGADLSRLRVTVNTSGGVDVLVFITNANGRQFSTPNSVITAGAWAHLRLSYRAAGATEADKVKSWIGGAAQVLTGSDVGAGGTIGALRSATGTGVFCAANDSSTPTSPLRNGGQIGPTIVITDTVLTDAEALLVRTSEVPT